MSDYCEHTVLEMPKGFLIDLCVCSQREYFYIQFVLGAADCHLMSNIVVLLVALLLRPL